MIRRSFLFGFLGLVALAAPAGSAFADGAAPAPKPAVPAKGAPELTAEQIADRVQSFYDRSKTSARPASSSSIAASAPTTRPSTVKAASYSRSPAK